MHKIMNCRVTISRPLVQTYERRCSLFCRYSTRPGAADRYLSPMQVVLSSRSKLLQSQPYEQLRVAGVTFEGRQDIVSTLEKGQALAFIREPDNPFDENAVRISTLDDQSRVVGYVPKTRTSSFIHTMCFGKVSSVGKPANQQQDVWGCIAEVQSRIPPMTVLPIPRNLHGKKSIDELTFSDKEKWNEFKGAILERSNGVCSISGAITNSIAELWEFIKENRTLKLAGFVAQEQEVTKIQRMLESGMDYTSELQRMNNWTEGDVDTYLTYMKRVREEYSDLGEWQVDMTILQGLGVQM